MTDRLASLFESAVSMLPMSEARSLDLFTEITNYDESACDAWIGRIRCGDTDRVTLFRAWYSRRNFGQLSGSVQISMSTLNRQDCHRGLYGDITYPVTSPLAITMGFAACEAAQGNYADAMEALNHPAALLPPPATAPRTLACPKRAFPLPSMPPRLLPLCPCCTRNTTLPQHLHNSTAAKRASPTGKSMPAHRRTAPHAHFAAYRTTALLHSKHSFSPAYIDDGGERERG
ncbi:hypothetical protein ABLN86_08415, partial [Mycobacterium tuberculosis]